MKTFQEFLAEMGADGSQFGIAAGPTNRTGPSLKPRPRRINPIPPLTADSSGQSPQATAMDDGNGIGK